MNNKVLPKVSKYYANRIANFGLTPMGVDWNGEGSQKTRFDQLTKIIDCDGPFRICDLGCGYAALYDFLDQKGLDFFYHGVDISDEMLEASKTSLQNKQNFMLAKSLDKLNSVDFTVASGIFNVKLDFGLSEWNQHILMTLHEMASVSLKGFSFNCLSNNADEYKMQDKLYYGDPMFFFDYCIKNFSSNVALLHDYNLYEFTILVRAEA